jgi:hypothetical protein
LAKNTMLCDNKSDETTVESLLYWVPHIHFGVYDVAQCRFGF